MSGNRSNNVRNLVLSDDFFGYLKDKTIEEKSLEVLKLYGLIDRFTIVKILKKLNDNIFLVILLTYLMKTQMTRIHKRSVLNKHTSAYYRVAENLINNSFQRAKLMQVLEQDASFIVKSTQDIDTNGMQLPIGSQLFDSVVSDGQPSISFSKL